MVTESKMNKSRGATKILLTTLIIICIFCHLFLIYRQVIHWQHVESHYIGERDYINEQRHIANLGYMIRYVGVSALWIIYGLWAAFFKDSLPHKLVATGVGIVLALAIELSQIAGI